jgi:hypothetical protein
MKVSDDILEAEALEVFERLVEFCRGPGAVCYGTWNEAVLRDYIKFHLAQGTFVFVKTLGQVCGTGVAWQCDQAEIFAAHEAGRPEFAWRASNDKGNALFVADFVCVVPGAAAAIIRHFTARFPAWRDLEWLTFRRGRLVRLCHSIVLKHYLKGQCERWTSPGAERFILGGSKAV